MTLDQALELFAFIMCSAGAIAGVAAFVGVVLVRNEAIQSLAEEDCRYARRNAFQRNMSAATRQ